MSPVSCRQRDMSWDRD